MSEALRMCEKRGFENGGTSPLRNHYIRVLTSTRRMEVLRITLGFAGAAEQGRSLP